MLAALDARGSTVLLDLGKYELDVKCPNCHFYNPIYLRQAQLREVIICRGCKGSIRLDDHMNQTKKMLRDLRRAVDDFERTLRSFGR